MSRASATYNAAGVEPGVEAFLRKVDRARIDGVLDFFRPDGAALLETLRQVCAVLAGVGDEDSGVRWRGHFQQTAYHYCLSGPLL